MPNVGGKKYAYTAKGMAAAEKAAEKIGAMVSKKKPKSKKKMK